MKNVQLINKELLSDIHRKATKNTRKRVNYDLRNSSEDTSQRMLNALELGTHVPIHRHLITSETVVCMEGCLDWVFYEELPNVIDGGPIHDGEKALDETCFKEISRFRVCPRVGKFGIQVPQGVWHSIEVYEPSTILEAKDGPYQEESMIKKINKEKDNMKKKQTIHLCLAHMSDTGEEMKYINRAFDENWVAPLGPNVDGFEDDLKRFIAAGDKTLQEKEVVALASGTAAVHLGLIALGVGPGDEVLVQSFTFCASTNPICYLGATPIMIDSEPDTWNMDPALLEAAIQDRIAKTGKKPKAIVTVYLYGMPAKIDEIMAIARKYDIPVLEDAAEAFGSEYKGRMVGTFGDYGVLSFNGNKMITTSGGALICPNKEAKERVKWYAMQAREAYPYYQHEAIGYNYRMSNICAGIGRGQMAVARDHIAHHRHIAELYEEAFRDWKGIAFHKELVGMMASNYWLSTIVLDEDVRIKNEERAYAKAIEKAVGGAPGVVHRGGPLHTDCEPDRNVEALRIALQAENIESRPLWKPMHKQPVYKDAPAYVNGVSESIFKRGICLPSGPMVTDDDVHYIVDTIKENII